MYNSNNEMSYLQEQMIRRQEQLSVEDIEAPRPICNVVSSPPPDDECVTIANNTFACIVLDPHLAEAVPQLSTVTPENQTTEEGHGKSYDNGKNASSDKTASKIDTKNDDDDETQPETPDKNGDARRGENSAFVATPFAGIERSKKTKDTKELPSPSQMHRRGYSRHGRFTVCLACVLSIVLLGAIGLLGYTLFEIRHKEYSRLFGKSSHENASQSETPSTSGTSSADNGNNSDEENFGGIDPHEISKTKIMEEIKATILLTTPDASEALADSSSVQYSVLEWLVNDPFVETYSGTKIIQRYALGCFLWSLNSGSADGNVVLRSSIADTWMTYSDECTNWGTTADRVCDDSGRIISISLNDVGLSGTLASEIALLSNSLETIFLTLNNIQGEIPPALGQLSKLKRIQLSRNKLKGTLPTTLGRLTDLVVLSTASNQLSGSLPTQLGLLTSLTFLSLSSNKFTGTLPSELGALEHLDFLSVQSNGLHGQIPDELSNLSGLSTLWLSNNSFVGSVPTGVCNGIELDVSVDCGEVNCPCCSGCGVDSGDVHEEANIEATTGVLNSENGTMGTSNSSVVSQTGNSSGISDTEGNAHYVQNTSTSQPYPIDANMEITNTPNFDCYDIQVGFDCYKTNWAIDFVTAMCIPQQYNLIAVNPLPNTTVAAGTTTLQTTSFVGRPVPMNESLFWATNCMLQDCDGVVEDGTVYYRNQFPEQTSMDMMWPLPNGQYVLRIIQSDEFGLATVLAESKTFIVADQCVST